LLVGCVVGIIVVILFLRRRNQSKEKEEENGVAAPYNVDDGVDLDDIKTATNNEYSSGEEIRILVKNAQSKKEVKDEEEPVNYSKFSDVESALKESEDDNKVNYSKFDDEDKESEKLKKEKEEKKKNK